MTPAHRRYVLILAGLFLIEWVALAIAPLYRHDWLLENLLVVAFVLLLAVSYRRLPLSRVSYSLIFLFLCLHEVGSHYTYAEVPYDEWFRALTGNSLNEMMSWQRNHFDRLVHFAYGLLLAYPLREVFLRVADVRGFWGYFLPLDFTMSTSMLYELIEWGAAETVGGDLGAGLPGHPGRRLGRPQGHGPGQSGRRLGHGHHGGDQRPAAAGFRPGMGRKPAGQESPAPGRSRNRAAAPGGRLRSWLVGLGPLRRVKRRPWP